MKVLIEISHVGGMNRAAPTQMALARIRGPNLSAREERIRLGALWLDRETIIAIFGWDPKSRATELELAVALHVA